MNDAVRAAMSCGVLLLLTGAAPVRDAQITIDNFAFSTPRLEIAAGTRVTWTNRDDIPHTVADAENPRTTKSPPLDTGDSYNRLFAKPGTYRYFCSLHPRMQGMVVVH